MEITAGSVTLVVGFLLLLALLVVYASSVGTQAHVPDEPVPTGNPSMERKVVLVLGMMIVSGLLLTAYAFVEPERQARAADRQESLSIGRAMETFSSNCIVCHGVDGHGAVVPESNPPRVAPVLNRNDLRNKDAEGYKEAYNLVIKTVSRGRQGTPMAAWSKEEGGPLLPEQIHELALLVTKGDKEIPFEGKTVSVWEAVKEKAREKIAHGAPAPKVPEIAASADLTADEKAGLDIWKGKGACIGCHAIGGVGGATGPNQGQMGSIAATRKPGMSAADYIRESILQPQAYLLPGYPPVMPGFQGTLTDDEINKVIAYLLTLK